MKWLWDYDLADNWRPQTPQTWEWFLVRKLNYGEYEGLTRKDIQTHFPQIKKRLDPGVADMIAHFLTYDPH
ncbi:hypothetical protein A3D77_03840 [Candidatus Gottesmanbacteria bacterium RIFCSPHIGHO2_02_FULL_39_11]|uniref:Uncharacterized protein n=1 Tax=Candidatus Gottesmanbacteria bacterium RIFCSPHIGHO2_02_FULL_39_11 TaxID=1798382 RepID=A0A1F5ZJP1_9BACT|nr:MAG: hypothetical protein A3D77_03840 [Candidatus Gottesmanbacteria bacterium RIFCSPHIGHO2_02_FULL_39_11]